MSDDNIETWKADQPSTKGEGDGVALADYPKQDGDNGADEGTNEAGPSCGVGSSDSNRANQHVTE